MDKRWLLLVIIFLLSGCASEDPVKPEIQKEERKELPDPAVEVEGVWAFAGVGADIEVPVGAENAKYFIISDKIAEIQFTRNGVPYSYRASQSEEDLIDMQSKAQDVEGLQAVIGDHVIPIQEAEDGFIAVWKWGGIFYSLSAKEQVDGGIMRALVEELGRETMPSQV